MDLLTAIALQHNEPGRLLYRNVAGAWGRTFRHARCMPLDNATFVDKRLPEYGLEGSVRHPHETCAGCGRVAR